MNIFKFLIGNYYIEFAPTLNVVSNNWTEEKCVQIEDDRAHDDAQKIWTTAGYKTDTLSVGTKMIDCPHLGRAYCPTCPTPPSLPPFHLFIIYFQLINIIISFLIFLVKFHITPLICLINFEFYHLN